MLPIPDKLRGKFKIDHQFENSEFLVKGQIVCSCGCKEFLVMYFGEQEEDYLISKKTRDGYLLAIKLICQTCKDEVVLFCNSLDGYDGFICDIHTRLQKNETFSHVVYKKTSCVQCKNETFAVNCTIDSSGLNVFKEDFRKEIEQGIFLESDWVNAYDWIVIGTKCANCMKEVPEYISYECS